jgi:methylmalonyl-CoA/ethylmalonyl-CoA epimerase
MSTPRTEDSGVQAAKIDHLAIAVPDIEAALAFYRDALGLAVGAVEDVPREGVRIAFLPLGDSHIELVQPTEPGTGIAKWMAKHAQGMHHVCIAVPDIDAALSRLRAHDVELINPEPVSKPNGTRYAFVHPRSASGVLVELYQKADGGPQTADGR